MRFQEVQRFSLTLITLVALVPSLVVAALLFLSPLGGGDGAVALFVMLAVVVVITAILSACTLTTEVDSQELRVRFFPFTSRTIAIGSITGAESRRYAPLRDYGGWGIRWGRGGMAFTIEGDRGVQVDLSTGRHILIGSADPDALVAAIRR